MTPQLALEWPEYRALSPYVEMGTYEALWSRCGTSFKILAELFRSNPGSVPSDFVPQSEALRYADRASAMLAEAGIKHLAAFKKEVRVPEGLYRCTAIEHFRTQNLR
jgi:hypothetical protein